MKLRGIHVIAMTLSVIVSTTIIVTMPVHAQGLSELIPTLLKTHNLVKASEADVNAADQRTRESLGGWFPALNVTVHYGREWQRKPTGTDDTELTTREADFSITQKLWDFGAVSSTIRASRLGKDVADHSLQAVKQDLILRGVTAYLNVLRSAEVVGFSIQSETNIKKQADLEDALVRRGAGLSTDVLQAKSQLAGAQARRIQSQGAHAVARNAYHAVFKLEVGNISNLKNPVLPMDRLPDSIGKAIDTALRENPKLKTADAGAAVIKETINSTRANSYFPKIDFIAESKFKEDANGTVGRQQELLGKFQLSFPFNLGFTAINTIKAAESDSIAANRRVGESRTLIEQQVRDAWAKLNTAKGTLVFLLNQSAIAEEFLELARKEQKLGNRTLLDVLAGETTLFNANSDASSAKTDVAISVYTLLNAMGRLSEDSIVDR